MCCLSIFCGTCRQCLSGYPNRCTNPAATGRPKGATPRLSRDDGTSVGQFARLGGFAELMLVHENGVVKITEDIALDKAALIGCGVLTGSGAVFRTARVEPGSRVVRHRRRRHRPGRHPGRPHRRGRHGHRRRRQRRASSRRPATSAPRRRSTPPTPTTWSKAVKELSGGGVDYSFEAIGKKATAEQAFSMLDIGGTATIIGMVPDDQRLEIRAMDLLSEKRAPGVDDGLEPVPHRHPAAASRCTWTAGLDLDAMVSKTPDPRRGQRGLRAR